MAGIDRLSSAPDIGLPALSGGASSATLAARVIGEIGGRILAWTDIASGRSGTAAASGFAPDRAKLERGGDVYELRTLSEQIGSHFGASPTEQGRLLRAVEDVAREMAVPIFGLAGSDRQLDSNQAATADALSATAADSVDGVIQRLETAAHRLRELNG